MLDVTDGPEYGKVETLEEVVETLQNGTNNKTAP